MIEGGVNIEQLKMGWWRGGNQLSVSLNDTIFVYAF